MNQEINALYQWIQTLNNEILICGQKSDRRSKQLDNEEKKAKNFIVKWQNKNNIQQEEDKIVKTVLFGMKK